MSVRILQGDCRDALKTLPDESVHCVVTSPPYFGLRDYGVVGQMGLEATPEAFIEGMVEVFEQVRRVLRDDGTLWLNMGDSYATNGGPGWQGKNGQRADRRFTGTRNTVPMREQARTAHAGHKPKDMLGIPWMLAFALRADGWYLRQDIIWSKPNPMPESVRDRCTKAHEYIFLLSKSERYYFDADAIAEDAKPESAARYGYAFGGPKAEQMTMEEADGPGSRTHPIGMRQPKARGKWSKEDPQSSGKRITDNVARARAEGADHDNPFGDTRNKRSVWTVTTKPFSEAHFATFPPDLIEPCILAGCPAGGVVLDPFGGAGTTGLVADRHGRDAILIELNPEYAEMAKRRITNDSPLFSEVA